MIARVFKTLWAGVALLVLYLTLDLYDGKEYSDIWLFLTWAMIVLSFPSSLIISLAHMALGAGLSITIQTSYLTLAIEWVVYFFLGYLQWFVLLPWLWRKWAARGGVS
jgi:hypothetical protein